MTLDPNDLLLFARVAEEGSLSRAAERLGVPKSTVSRRLSALERTLGEPLLRRTTRRLTLTDFGHAVLEHARQVVVEVRATEAIAEHRQLEPTGRLRVSMPGDLANVVLAPVLAAFIARHPAIVLEVDLSARFVDLVAENFDVAIRMGALQDDATLAARRVATFTIGLYASPAYLARYGQPDGPGALMDHRVLRVLGRTGDALPWTLVRNDDRWHGSPPVRSTANSPELLMRLALDGAGIVLVNDLFALPHVERGELAPVLSDWAAPAVDAWAVFPGRRLMPARTRALLDALAAHFTAEDCAARQADVIERKRKQEKAPRDRS